MKTRDERRRRRWTDREKEELVAAWQRSGMGAIAFAKGRDVCASNLERWKRAGIGANHSAPRFVEVRVASGGATAAESPAVVNDSPLPRNESGAWEVVCPSGHRVRVPRGFEVNELRALLGAIGGGGTC